MRNRLFEFEDQTWLPDFIRNGMTDFLQLIFSTFNLYDPVVPLLSEVLQKTSQNSILDLCSGGGGPLLQIEEKVQKKLNKEINITLTDKFPNFEKYKYISRGGFSRFSFLNNSIDATAVPSDIKGLRTMFSASHHFPPEALKKILKSASDNKKSIAIFDGGSKSIFLMFTILLTFPFLFFLITPFLRPFRISRVLFTYLIPIIPLFTIWDGIVSIDRLYTSNELLQMAGDRSSVNYIWKSGNIKSRFGMKITYLIGYPKAAEIVSEIEEVALEEQPLFK